MLRKPQGLTSSLKDAGGTESATSKEACMLIDTHCHIDAMVKSTFNTPLRSEDYESARQIVAQAAEYGVTKIMNVGTSLIESENTLGLASRFKDVYASIGIHPNDLTDTWKEDLKKIAEYLERKEELKILAIGECGMDKHYPGYNIVRQQDAFKMQIELALEHDLALVVHTRDAPEETLHCLEEYKNQGLRGTIHCFSEDLPFAQSAIAWGFVLGIGGTVTYPKNNVLRSVVRAVGIDHIILETDAPFLPPQIIRGKQNHPKYIRTIAEYIADMLTVPFDVVAETTTKKALSIFWV